LGTRKAGYFDREFKLEWNAIPAVVARTGVEGGIAVAIYSSKNEVWDTLAADLVLSALLN